MSENIKMTFCDVAGTSATSQAALSLREDVGHEISIHLTQVSLAEDGEVL
jgi:hypothetical protein